MIIVEGVDGAGKTTLINSWHKEHPGYEIHPSAGPVYDKDQLEKRMANSFRYCKLSGIHDRITPISEYIYGKVIRGSSFVTLKEMGDFLTAFDRPQNLIVFLDRHYEHVRTKEEMKDHDDEVEEKIPRLMKEYRKLFKAIRSDMHEEYFKKFHLLSCTKSISNNEIIKRMEDILR